MNNSKAANAEETWVCCPTCGRKNLKSQMGIHPVKCDGCKKDFYAWVIKGGVLVLPESEENMISTYSRYSKYMSELMKLAIEK